MIFENPLTSDSTLTENVAIIFSDSTPANSVSALQTQLGVSETFQVPLEAQVYIYSDVGYGYYKMPQALST